MGAGWYLARRNAGPEELPHKGRALLFAQYQLEEIATLAGLPPLKAFFSSDPQALAAYFHAAGIERTPDEFPDEEWHDPAEVLTTVRALIDKLDEAPTYVPNLDRVREDLNAMAEVLRTCQTEGDRVHVATGLPHRDGPPDKIAD